MPGLPQRAESAPAPEEEGTRPRSDEASGQLALRLVAANARLNAVALATAAGLIVLGLWTYLGIEQSLRDMRAAGLQAILDTNLQTLQLWINDRKADAEHWARDARVQARIGELLAARSTDAPAVASAHRALQELLAPAL